METVSKSSAYKWRNVFLFGDSLTQHSFSENGTWASILADKLQRKCDVISRGFSGYNTRACKFILPHVVSEQEVPYIAAFVIFLGANDGTRPPSSTRVPLEEYQQHLEDMVKYLVEIGVARDRIILVSAPPCSHDDWAPKAERYGMVNTVDNALKRPYAEACREAAERTGCRFVDTYSNFINKKNWRQMLSDGLHFSVEGSRYFESLLWPHIEALTRDIPILMPGWSDIDFSDMEKSFSQSKQEDAS